MSFKNWQINQQDLKTIDGYKINKMDSTQKNEKLGETKYEMAGRNTKFCRECKLVSKAKIKWYKNLERLSFNIGGKMDDDYSDDINK